MLHQFTWLQFLLAALILSLIWYGALALFVFREQLIDLLKGRQRVGAGPVAAAGDHYDALNEFPLSSDQPEKETEILMGKPATPEGMSTVPMNGFGFAGPGVSAGSNDAPADGAEFKDEDARRDQQSFIPDVLEELKQIFAVLESQQGSKADFMALFDLVKGKYPALKSYHDRALLNEFIRGHVLFPISDAELEELWT